MQNKIILSVIGVAFLGAAIILFLEPTGSAPTVRTGSDPAPMRASEAPERNGGSPENSFHEKAVESVMQARELDTPPAMERFNPDRMTYDRDYRLAVWHFALNRYLDIQRATGCKEIEQITGLLERYGIPPPLSNELVRLAYESISDAEQYRRFAEQNLKELEDFRQHMAEAEISEEWRQQKLRLAEKLQTTVASNWITRAEASETWSIERFQRESGITDPAFYEELFSIPVERLATPIPTNVARNTQLVGPDQHY